MVDVSFIGLAKVLPAVAACAATRFDLLALVKPQFEVGRDRVGKGGVVRERRPTASRRSWRPARRRVHSGMSVQGYCSSGLPGPAGNLESFVWCTEAARDGVHDLVAAARREPEAASAVAMTQAPARTIRRAAVYTHNRPDETRRRDPSS